MIYVQWFIYDSEKKSVQICIKKSSLKYKNLKEI